MGDRTDAELIMKEIFTLLESQRIGVLATEGEMGPYTNIVSFTYSRDLKHLYFATTRATRKYSNISSHDMVSLLVDDRTNTVDDLYQAKAVTIIGRSRELEGYEKEQALTLMESRHPYLVDFISSPTTATIKIHVMKYILVTRFQNVREVLFHEENDNTSR